MNILLVTDSYPPEIRSASHLMLELAEELHHRGHRVTVITTWPEYNLDQAEAPRAFDEIEVENGITVIRVRTLPHHNVNYIVRGISQLLMPVQFLMKLRRHRIRPDAAIVYSPPLPLALVGPTLRLMDRADYDPFRFMPLPLWRRQWALWRAARNPKRIAAV